MRLFNQQLPPVPLQIYIFLPEPCFSPALSILDTLAGEKKKKKGHPM